MKDPISKISSIDDETKQPQKAEEVFGCFRTVSTKSTGIPSNWFKQVEIYISGGTKLLRIYDTVNNTWREITIN